MNKPNHTDPRIIVERIQREAQRELLADLLAECDEEDDTASSIMVRIALQLASLQEDDTR